MTVQGQFRTEFVGWTPHCTNSTEHQRVLYYRSRRKCVVVVAGRLVWLSAL